MRCTSVTKQHYWALALPDIHHGLAPDYLTRLYVPVATVHGRPCL